MHAFDVLGDPVRRRILELLAEGEAPAGKIAETICLEFGITPPAVSQQLKVLRLSGFAMMRPKAQQRIYSIGAKKMREADAWLSRFRSFWDPKLDALSTEVARGRKKRGSV